MVSVEEGRGGGQGMVHVIGKRGAKVSESSRRLVQRGRTVEVVERQNNRSGNGSTRIGSRWGWRMVGKETSAEVQ
jgi:hypothetical protein